MNPTYDFSGQVALVTGAAAGMGLDTARAFAAAGAAVVLADVNEQALGTETDELNAAGHRALGVACDVADEDQVAALVDRTVAEFGRLDMAFKATAQAFRGSVRRFLFVVPGASQRGSRRSASRENREPPANKPSEVGGHT